MKASVVAKTSLGEIADYLLVSSFVWYQFGWIAGLAAFGACDLLLKFSENFGRGNPNRQE